MILGLAALMGVLTSCGQKAIASRKAIVELAKAKAKGWTMYGMHFPTTEGMAVK